MTTYANQSCNQRQLDQAVDAAAREEPHGQRFVPKPAERLKPQPVENSVWRFHVGNIDIGATQCARVENSGWQFHVYAFLSVFAETLVEACEQMATDLEDAAKGLREAVAVMRSDEEAKN